jgi:single-strand DNA-binding protein
MAGDTTITVIGNLTDDPELRFTPSGAAVAKFRVASTPRFLDRQSGEWKDGEPLFLACTVWRQAAEKVAESLQRGTRVIVSGRLKQRSYETREGEKRTVFELEVDEVGPSLRYATAKVQKMSRSGGNGGFGASGGDGGFGGSRGSQGGGSQGGGSQGGGYADDPWASAQPAGRSAPSGGGGGSGSSFDDEPPF